MGEKEDNLDELGWFIAQNAILASAVRMQISENKVHLAELAFSNRERKRAALSTE